MKTLKVDDPVRFIKPFDIGVGQAVPEGAFGIVRQVVIGGYTIYIPRLLMSVIVGNMDWFNFVEVNHFYNMRDGQILTVIKTPACSIMSKSVKIGDRFKVTGRKSLAPGPDALVVQLINDAQRLAGLEVLCLPNELNEYFSIDGLTSTPVAVMKLPDSLKSWYGHVSPHLERR